MPPPCLRAWIPSAAAAGPFTLYPLSTFAPLTCAPTHSCSLLHPRLPHPHFTLHPCHPPPLSTAPLLAGAAPSSLAFATPTSQSTPLTCAPTRRCSHRNDTFQDRACVAADMAMQNRIRAVPARRYGAGKRGGVRSVACERVAANMAMQNRMRGPNPVKTWMWGEWAGWGSGFLRGRSMCWERGACVWARVSSVSVCKQSVKG